MAIEFQAPPINEVVIGKVYEPRLDLTVPYYGRFWELVEDDFPQCQHATPIVDQSTSGDVTVAVDPASGAILPRVWFKSREATRLLQLQQDRFYFDWRQLPGESREYIRFESIFRDYRKYADVLSAFIVNQFGSELEPKRYDLTYVNVFEQGVEWNQFSDLQSLFRGFDFIRAYGDIGSVVQGGLRLEFSMHTCPGKLNFHLASGKNMVTQSPVIRMELAATCFASDLPGVKEDDWFHGAHEAIVKSFCDLTTEDAQKRYWKRIS